MKSEIVGKLL